jgi:uncharacterized protein (UPF0261 family)
MRIMHPVRIHLMRSRPLICVTVFMSHVSCVQALWDALREDLDKRIKQSGAQVSR